MTQLLLPFNKHPERLRALHLAASPRLRHVLMNDGDAFDATFPNTHGRERSMLWAEYTQLAIETLERNHIWWRRVTRRHGAKWFVFGMYPCLIWDLHRESPGHEPYERKLGELAVYADEDDIEGYHLISRELFGIVWLQKKERRDREFVESKKHRLPAGFMR